MYENSDSFRDYVDLERYGVTPTVTIAPSADTKITLALRVPATTRASPIAASRRSRAGRPTSTVDTFYGNPDDSHVRRDVNLGVGDRRAPRRRASPSATARSFGDYDRFYQNFVPGAVTADQVAGRAHGLQQRDRAARTSSTRPTSPTVARPAAIRHTLLAGAEFGRQLTDNFRNTGFFNNTATSILVPFATPTISTPVTFRQSATDADNHLTTNVAAAYVQDQVELSRHVQVVGGLRFDRFDLTYHNNRNGDTLEPRRQPGLAARRRRLQAGRRRCRSTAATACRICRAPAISSRR